MFTFKTPEDFDRVENMIKNSYLYWRKIKQDAQGKICLQCDGTQTHYTISEAEEQMADCMKMLEEIENTPHYSWNGEEYVLVESDQRI